MVNGLQFNYRDGDVVCSRKYHCSGGVQRDVTSARGDEGASVT